MIPELDGSLRGVRQLWREEELGEIHDFWDASSRVTSCRWGNAPSARCSATSNARAHDRNWNQGLN
jgi:hypothetical protein